MLHNSLSHPALLCLIRYSNQYTDNDYMQKEGIANPTNRKDSVCHDFYRSYSPIHAPVWGRDSDIEAMECESSDSEVLVKWF